MGEVIDVVFQINNGTNRPLSVNKSGIATGGLKLFISQDGENYREYVGPGWGLVDLSGEVPVKIEAGDNFETRSSVLFNHHIPTAHLSPLYAEKYRRERIDTEFVATRAGRYWLKAIFRDGIIALESEPLAIEISEPDRLDAEVWERIKTDGAFAYLLHIGQVKYRPDSDESRRFLESAQQIVEEFPGSIIAERIREKLAEYYRNLENER